MKQAVRYYRALSFGKPVGPWRDNRDAAQRDMVALELGCYDEWGQFYISVPGEMETSWRHVEILNAA